MIPGGSLLEVGKVLGHGAEKYIADGWRPGTPWRQQFASLMRHALAWSEGEDFDPESGFNHMAHVAARALFLLDFAARAAGVDDRFKQTD